MCRVLLIMGPESGSPRPTYDGHTTHPGRPVGMRSVLLIIGRGRGPVRAPADPGQLTPRYASWIDGSASSSAPGPERVTSPVSST